MITSFLFKAFIIYIMGGLIAAGIYYSAMNFFIIIIKDGKYEEDLDIKKNLFIAFILSWISVAVFVYEFLKGIIKAFNDDKNNE